MTNLDRIKQLKSELVKRHISFYTDEDGKVKRYDINSNQKWIKTNIDQSWKNDNNQYLIKGFDFVSSSLVEVDASKIIYDTLCNEFYDGTNFYIKGIVKDCEKTLKLISDSWFDCVQNSNRPKPQYRINKQSEKYKGSPFFSFSGKGLHRNANYAFNDTIDGVHYNILIPSSYIRDNYANYFETKYYGLISKRAILDYINKHKNDLIDE